MVYKRVRGWTSGRRLAVYNVIEYPPPPATSANVLKFLSRDSRRLGKDCLLVNAVRSQRQSTALSRFCVIVV